MENKGNKFGIVIGISIVLLISLGVLVWIKNKDEDIKNPVPENPHYVENNINLVSSDNVTGRYSVKEENNVLVFNDSNYMRDTKFTGYSGTITKSVISAGCNDDDMFIVVSLLTSDGLYALTLDDEGYYQNTKESYEFTKISNNTNISDIYSGSNVDENDLKINSDLICSRYVYVKYSDNSLKAIVPYACENNIYCSGEMNLVSIK